GPRRLCRLCAPGRDAPAAVDRQRGVARELNAGEESMQALLWSLPIVVAMLAGAASAACAAEPRTQLGRHGGGQVEGGLDGGGPAVVLLPSLAGDSADYDAVAEGLAAAGFLVLRPKPRGIGRSSGPMTNITLHDLARDVAEAVAKLGGGRAVVV